MKHLLIAALALLLVAPLTGLSGCAVEQTIQRPADPQAHFQREIEKASATLARRQAEQRQSIEKTVTRTVDLQPILPAYDPLEDYAVSFSMVDEPIQTILYSLARAVGMNLILDPAIKDENRRLTLNFENVPAARVLREVLASYDLFYVTEDNIIRVKPYQEQIFSLNFLNTEVKSEFSVGGDVLGAGESGSVSGLSGNFKLSGRSAAKNNVFDVVEDNLKTMISGNGKYALNRLSGSLYVKDSPTVIKAVSRMIHHLRTMLDRQILIEARIVEVALTDEHRYGIDWSALRDSTADLAQSVLTGWSLGEGLILNYQENKYAVDAVLEALDTYGDSSVISNPSIRSKHSVPAVISVGTSISYKKSIQQTRTLVGSNEDRTTEVEVSTVFDGLILGVIPFIEADGNISLLINPIQSEVDRESLVPEPIGGTDSDASISLPMVRIKEISTTISLRDKEVVILGGLIDKRYVKEDNSVPGLSSVPVLRHLFRNNAQVEENRELVIILSVSMV